MYSLPFKTFSQYASSLIFHQTEYLKRLLRNEKKNMKVLYIEFVQKGGYMSYRPYDAYPKLNFGEAIWLLANMKHITTKQFCEEIGVPNVQKITRAEWPQDIPKDKLYKIEKLLGIRNLDFYWYKRWVL